MKILITGSNGLLGQKLLALCLRKGTEVIATSLGRNRFDDSLTYLTMDITNSAEVEEVIGKTKPDVIINTAAMTNVDQCEDEKERCLLLNVAAVKNLVQSCEKHNSFLVHLSTDFVFDGSHGPLNENDKPNPVNFYGESKLKSELLIQESKCGWAIARTILVYGVLQNMSRSNIILWVKESLEKGIEIQVVDDQFRTPTLAEDLADGCYLIATKQAAGIWNISGKDLLTPYQMAIKTAEFFNLDQNLIKRTNSSAFRQRAVRPLKTGLVIEKAQSQLGYNPHSFEEGIQIVAEQMSQPN
ncbi:MAG TPA: SDR family oxidoreductase [Cyclobacteriaceae bacterium]